MTTLDEARQDAERELRAVLALDSGWPDIPEPAVNDCRIDQAKAIQLTYFVHMPLPEDPAQLVENAAAHWKAAGFEVERYTGEWGGEAGTEFAANARRRGHAHPSIGATNVSAQVYVDSVCVLGDPDDYR